MENRVGDNVPSADEMAALLQDMRSVVERIKKFGIILDSAERQRILHWRRGAEPHIQTVHDLAEKHGVKLPKIPLTGMLNDVALAKQMHPFVETMRAGLTLAEDTAGQAESEAWEAFLAYYGVLSGMASRDADIAAELSSVTEFMANGSRKKPT